MTEKLTVRVLHPHPLDGVMLFPGDEVEMSRDRFLQLDSTNPFPYFHIVAGSIQDESGTELKAPAELPFDDTPTSLGEPSEVEMGEEVSAEAHPELPLEGELPEEVAEEEVKEEAPKKSRKK
jgi:hypothetical protein